MVHGDDGVAGPWAANATPGDALVFAGPSGAYRPDPGADWHLMVGDESALPAIAASLDAVPGGAPVVVRLLVNGPTTSRRWPRQVHWTWRGCIARATPVTRTSLRRRYGT